MHMAAMDAAGIDVQILSNVPGAEAVEPSLAVELSRQANDEVAAAVAQHPDRFRGFATLPMRDPAAAARELERAVRDRGFVGALINGHVNGRLRCRSCVLARITIELQQVWVAAGGCVRLAVNAASRVP